MDLKKWRLPMKAEEFLIIKNWLLRNARTLESARFARLFETIDPVHVVDCLKAYQNPDGGFGHGLEPDCRNPLSSPIQSWAALEVIDELGLPSDHEIVMNLINYLVFRADKSEGKWVTLIPSNNKYPHASWWHYEEKNRIWGYNPTAALAGFILKHTNPYEKEHEFALAVAKKAIATFLATDITEMHELRSFLELHQYLSCKETCDNYLLFTDKLRSQILAVVETNEKNWFSSYSVRPSQFVASPKDFFYPDLKKLIDCEVDLLMKNRNKDGVWDVSWNWGQYPEDFAIAKKEWQGILIVSNLKMLRDFGKL